MRVLFVGGGTGGHLTPALGLAEALEERGHRTLFLVSGRAVEQAYFVDGRAHASLGYHTVRLPGPLALPGAMRRARAAARDFRPDLVVALGGGASAAALAVGGPRVLLEGNVVPGRSVRWMQPFARATLTLFPETAQDLRHGVCVGPLTRRMLEPLPRAVARARLGLPAEGPLLLCLGGSQGAGAVNRVAAALAPRLAASGAHILALCGPGRARELADAAASHPRTLFVREHCAEMGAAYSAADFGLTRGGAATVAELWLHALPAVIVPYPHHKDRQQERNAAALAPGLKVVREEQLDAAALGEIAAAVLDPAAREAMRAHLATLRDGRADGRAQAVRVLEEIARAAT
jgi:UDP-N-acetylglucosamine--N-acetylmuramyl-(pentapeptide) pyrophosphoryl-undecaprenol N-acetylglucosamine transferase